jgi:prepilin-type N-terminal cleavage/methylation domain-containing protein
MKTRTTASRWPTPPFMRRTEGQISRPRSGFTLIELLTVIAIIAVLASLLLTTLASTKKKARTVVCTSNLHQFTVALNLFMDDSDGKRPAVSNLVSGNFLTPQSLLCPEDKTGNWGQLVSPAAPFTGFAGTNIVFLSTNSGPFNYSYLLQPLAWDDAEWRTLKDAGSRAGVAACQLHGLGNQNFPDLHNYSGLLLRAQLDGSIVRRQFFWSVSASPAIIPNIGFNSPVATDALQIFFDDPTLWQAFQ